MPFNVKKQLLTAIALHFLGFVLEGQTHPIRAWVKDTSKVISYVERYYESCLTIRYDTSYLLKSEKYPPDNYILFYDAELLLPNRSYLVIGDTTFATTYYRNGQIKKRELFIGDFKWGQDLYKVSTWCENGTLTSSELVDYTRLTHAVVLHCNGVTKFEGKMLYGFPYDTLTWFYDNGQKRTQKYYTSYNSDSTRQQRSKEISHPRYWTTEGDTLGWQFEENGINTIGGATEYCSQTSNGLTPYAKMDKSPWHSMSMEVLRDSIYRIVRKPDSCYCSYGSIAVGFFLEKDGRITGLRIDHDVDPSIANALKKAFDTLAKWPPATVNGEPIRTYLPVFFSVEKMN